VESLSDAGAPRRAVVFVAGPTGSGKSTLISRLRRYAATYTENVAENPFLTSANESFDAAASQTWFVDRIEQFSRAEPRHNLAIDQHPLAISKVYGELFRREGLISNADFRGLEVRVDRLVEAIASSAAQVLTVCMTADTRLLWERLEQRPIRPLSRDQVKQINLLFSGLVYPGPCMVFNSGVVDPVVEEQLVTRWLLACGRQAGADA
jgi:deoxyadenosine/deoxycytidine kinase